MALGDSSFTKAGRALALEGGLIVSPYSDAYTHMHSLAHPIFHAIQFGIDIVKLLGGVVQLIVSPLSFSGTVMADAFFGVRASHRALVCDVLACAISVVSIVTRTVVSLGGYTSSGICDSEEAAGILIQLDAENRQHALPNISVPDPLPGMLP